jgi:tRNA pseudouridine55 synthase
MNGVLVVDKPPGPTSHDVVARARRATGISRIGHTGTLDPLATGVLPLVVGRATRLSQFLSVDEKEYESGIRFGSSTPSYDADLRIVADPATNLPVLIEPPPKPPPDLHAGRVREALANFVGTYFQAPPPFSAKKVGGVPAYKLARRNKPVDIRPVQVTVRSLRLDGYEAGLARLHVVCSAGFYVRSLAHDLGGQLGCGAHLEWLRRTRVGEFTVDRAIPLDQLEREGTGALRHLIPMDSLMPFLPPVVVNERGARRAAHGNALAPGDLAEPVVAAPAARVRVVDAEGTLLGIAEPADGGLLHPIVVLV